MKKKKIKRNIIWQVWLLILHFIYFCLQQVFWTNKYSRKVVCRRWTDTTLVPNGNRRRDCKPQVLVHKGDRVERSLLGNPCNSPPTRLKNDFHLNVFDTWLHARLHVLLIIVRTNFCSIDPHCSFHGFHGTFSWNYYSIYIHQYFNNIRSFIEIIFKF